MSEIAAFFFGVLLTGAIFAWRYGLGGPSPINLEAHTRAVKATQLHDLAIEKLVSRVEKLEDRMTKVELGR